MTQTPSPLTPIASVWIGLICIIIPLFVFIAYLPFDSFEELVYKSETAWGGPLLGFIPLMISVGSFILGVCLFFRGIFLLVFNVFGLFGDWVKRKRKAQKEQMIKRTTENKDRMGRKTVITPIEISGKDKIRVKIKYLLSGLPIIENESNSECRQKMINQSGSIHPSMYIGSLEKTVEFVVSMIQETENLILRCNGIVKVEKAFLISTWPTQKPVLEIQYEQFWDNSTSNVYSEHVMRIGSDEYEVFGSEKSNERMKTLWVEDAKVLCISCKAEMERADQYCPKCGNINENLKNVESNNDPANIDDCVNGKAKVKSVNDNDVNYDISSDKLNKTDQDTGSLADELIKIAITDGFLIEQKNAASDNRNIFNDQYRNKRAIEIGEILNKLGGMELMRNAFKSFQSGLYETHKQDLLRAKIMARELEWVWDGIGKWQG